MFKKPLIIIVALTLVTTTLSSAKSLENSNVSPFGTKIDDLKKLSEET